MNCKKKNFFRNDRLFPFNSETFTEFMPTLHNIRLFLTIFVIPYVI